MNDEPHAGSKTGSGGASSPPRIKPRQKLWRRFIRYQMRKSHQFKAEREKKYAEEKPEERASRKTAYATIWIAVFTVVLALASIFTLVELPNGLASNPPPHPKRSARQIRTLPHLVIGCFLFDSVPRALTRRVRSVEDGALPLHGSSAAIAATILMAAEVINPLWDAPVKSTDAGGVGRNQSPW